LCQLLWPTWVAWTGCAIAIFRTSASTRAMTQQGAEVFPHTPATARPPLLPRIRVREVPSRVAIFLRALQPPARRQAVPPAAAQAPGSRAGSSAALTAALPEAAAAPQLRKQEAPRLLLRKREAARRGGPPAASAAAFPKAAAAPLWPPLRRRHGLCSGSSRYAAAQEAGSAAAGWSSGSTRGSTCPRWLKRMKSGRKLCVCNPLRRSCHMIRVGCDSLGPCSLWASSLCASSHTPRC